MRYGAAILCFIFGAFEQDAKPLRSIARASLARRETGNERELIEQIPQEKTPPFSRLRDGRTDERTARCW